MLAVTLGGVVWNLIYCIVFDVKGVKYEQFYGNPQMVKMGFSLTMIHFFYYFKEHTIYHKTLHL